MKSKFEMSIRGFLRRAVRPRGINQVDGCVLATTLGRVRSENQDRLLHLTNLGSVAPKGTTLTILADGMGGMINGGAAAEIACAAFAASFLERSGMGIEQRLKFAALEADKAVFQDLRGKGGTTLTAALITRGVAFIVSVGDSRAYSFEKNVGIRQVTDDDTLGEMLRKSGQGGIAVDRATQLVQFVGLGEGVEPHSYNAQASKTSYVILTSDGAHSIGLELLDRLCSANESSAKIAESILATSTALGGNDNASIAVLQVDSPDSSPYEGDAIICVTAATGMELGIFLVDRGQDRLRVEDSVSGELALDNSLAHVVDVPNIEQQHGAVNAAKMPAKKRNKKVVRKNGKRTKNSTKKAEALSLDFPKGRS